MKTVSFVIEGIPGSKGRGRAAVSKSGKPFVYTPAKTRQYEGLVRQAYQEADPDHIREELHEGAVELAIEAYFPIPRNWPRWKKDLVSSWALPQAYCPAYKDWDNIAKVVTDALNGVAFRDDRQIVCAAVRKGYGPRGMVRVMLRFYDALPATRQKWEESDGKGKP